MRAIPCDDRRPRGRPVSPRRRDGRGGVAAIAVLAAGAAVIGPGAQGRARRGAREDAPPLRSVAVLPLADLSGRREPAYFADGMTEALIAQLSTASDLRVIARTSVMQFRAGGRRPGRSRPLNVDAVIEGSVLRAGDRVRVTARLVRGDTQETVGRGPTIRHLPDVLTLQSDVAGHPA